MRVVEVNILSIDDKTPATATVIVEEKRPFGWSRKEAVDVTSGKPEAQRRVLLSDDQRLIIEPREATEVVYDAEQMAATTRPVKADDAVTEGTGAPKVPPKLNLNQPAAKTSNSVK